MYRSSLMVTVRRSKCAQTKRSIAAIAIGTLALLLPQTVGAATFHCSAGNVPCLIAAINLANVNGENNTIGLDAGTYTLTAVDNTTGGLTNGLPSITGTMTIRGAGADQTFITRNPSNPLIQFRLFYVATTGNLTLDRLNLSHGFTKGGASGGHASGVQNNGGVVNIIRSVFADNNADAGTVEVNNDGVVNISESRFTHNSATFDAGGLNLIRGFAHIRNSTFDHNIANGAGAIRVLNDSTLVLTESSLTENTGAPVMGAGAIISFGNVVVINTTFARNQAAAASAIVNFGLLHLFNSTLSGNTFDPMFPGQVPALRGAPTAMTLIQNTIIALNIGRQFVQDCAGPIRSLGNNLIGVVTGCGIILQPSDLTGDPGLGMFTDNGKPGNGHFPLLKTSQAINAGNDAACPATDQIGQPRTGKCDLGAITFHKKDRKENEDDDDVDGPELVTQ